MTAGAFVTAKGIAGFVGGFFRSVPWYFWLFVAVVLVGWRYGEAKREAGVMAERDRWQAAQRDAADKAEKATTRRDRGAAKINQKTEWSADWATRETRETTAKAVERVRHVTRTITVPGNCPSTLPAVVRDAGRAAVDRANDAAGSH